MDSSYTPIYNALKLAVKAKVGTSLTFHESSTVLGLFELDEEQRGLETAEFNALKAERDRLDEIVDGIKEILSMQLYETVTVPLIEKLIAAKESEE